MPYDGIVLSGAVWEAGGLLAGGRIEKVFQTGRYEIILLCHSRSEKYRLLMSADPENPRMHLTKSKKENPLTAPPFSMVLRKHIQGGKIVSVTQEGYDRIVTVTIDTYNEMGDPVRKKLITEIMGKYSNIILTSENGTIFDSIRHVDSDMSSVREVMPGRPYILPPPQNKINPEDFTGMNMNETGEMPAHKAILSTISGFSPLLCRAICESAGLEPSVKISSLTASEAEALNEQIRFCCKDIADRRYTPAIINGGRDFHCVSAVCKTRTHSTVNLMLDEYFTRKDTKDRLDQKRASVMKYINAAMEKCRRKMQIHRDTMNETKDYEDYRRTGELLTANMYGYPEYAGSVKAVDYGAEGMPEVVIKLDESRSVSQNAQMYFKKYRKNRSAYENAVRHEKECRDELEYLESAAVMLENDTEMSDIEEARLELSRQGYIRSGTGSKDGGGSRGKNRAQEREPSSPRTFMTDDGYEILVGKNNMQNEKLTLRTAKPDDVWLHVKNSPGSHVILRASEHGGSLTAHAVECAAALAAYYSSASKSTKADVDYTRVKHVRKIPGGRPGAVNYVNYKTVTVKPSLINENGQA